MQWFMIGLGAALGAILRGALGRFNALHPWLPVGTLFANVLGGLLMGVALVYSERLSPAIRFFIMTGFLGGLTTFSTFSAEVFNLLNTGRFMPALLLIAAHLGFTLFATALSFYLTKLFIS